jgi:hypothetical protein
MSHEESWGLVPGVEVWFELISPSTHHLILGCDDNEWGRKDAEEYL